MTRKMENYLFRFPVRDTYCSLKIMMESGTQYFIVTGNADKEQLKAVWIALSEDDQKHGLKLMQWAKHGRG